MCAARRAAQLNRKGGANDSWKPLLWAARENQLMVATLLLEHGYNVNEQESKDDKGSSGWAPLHWAAQKGARGQPSYQQQNN